MGRQGVFKDPVFGASTGWMDSAAQGPELKKSFQNKYHPQGGGAGSFFSTGGLDKK